MNQNQNLKYQLDANGGLVISQEDLQYFINIESTINNINGWSQDKMNIRNEYLLIRNKLLQTFVNNNNEPQFQNIYYSFSVSDAIKSISNAVSDKNESIYLYPNHHPRIQKIFMQNESLQSHHKLQKDKSQKVCLINLLTSQYNIDQSDQIYDAEKQNFLYTIVDASQALGRVNLQEYLEYIDCLLISPRKVGGMSNLCFIFTTRQFDQKYISIDGTDSNQTYFLPETRFISYVLASARPVIDNFTAQYYDEEQNKLQYNTLVQQLSYFKDDIKVQNLNVQNIKDSDIQGVHKQDNHKQEDTNTQNAINIKHTYTSLIIELEKPLCPKLFQQELDKMGISVGFETSCQSNTSNKLRLSWRYIYPNINIVNEVEQALQACKEDVQNNDTNNNDNTTNTNNTLIGGSYKLKIQQDKQYDTKQGWQNLNQFNKHLFYLRGHWVPLNTDDNDAQRLKIPSKYVVMFQNFVLQQRQDYYLYIPELKEEFENWCEEKENQNYKLENIHALTYDVDIQSHKDVHNKQDDKDNKNSFQESLAEFEYLYRVSKHIYLTPFPTDELNQKFILTLSDFEFDEKEKRYPKLPDDFIQLFENTVSTDDNNDDNHKNILYPMTYTKYKKCLKQNINLQVEYINNPSSEFIIKLKLPIQEHYINESNSYKNIIKQSVKQSPNEYNDINIDEIDTNYIQVIQPYKSYMNETVIEKTKEMIKHNSKTKIILILHNPSIEQQDEIFKLGFEEVRNKILSYQNWFQQWYFDDNIYTYIKNVKKIV